MKKFFKVFLSIILILIVAAVIYFLFLKPDKARLFDYVPEDAFIMFYTDDFKDSWKELKSSDSWEIIRQQRLMDSSLKKINKIDSLINDNQFVDKVLSNHSLLLSLHPVKKEGLQALFYMDLMELSKFRFSYDLLEKRLFKDSDFKTRKINLNGNTVYEVTKNDSRYLLGIHENVLFISSSEKLFLKVLEKQYNDWNQSEDFITLDEKYRKRGGMHLYVNFSHINDVLQTQKMDPENYALWVNPLQYAVYNIDFKDDIVHFNGGISAKPHSHGYLNAFSDVGIGRSDAYEIISADIATYNSYNFNQFSRFNENLKRELAAIDNKAYSSYIETFDHIEKKFDIDIQEHVFNWIGEEIIVGKLKPEIGTSEMSDVFLAIRASNINTAKDMIELIRKRVSDKTPLKISSKSYKDHEIQYLDIKNFFKLFAGNLFENEEMDRPYFTYIDNYVVFSNSVNNLTTLIDHASEGKTLEYSKTFDDVFQNFHKRGNIQLYISASEFYESVYYHANAYIQKFLEEYRNLLLCIDAIGIQIKPKEEVYESEMRIKVNANRQEFTDIAAFEGRASKPQNELVENLEFKIDPQELDISADSTGKIKIYYPDSTIWHEGIVDRGEPDKLWREYYESGRIKSSVIYKNGKVDNYAVFYYDNPSNTIMINATFNQDMLINEYREFHKNGQLKAQIGYKQGKPEGEARFYYPNGNPKITGKYKEGEQKGKWKFYNQFGELIRERRF
ncbi:MAG: toxin-antitoxin system YwqK family antitoxin [Bacteroidota bacterium]